MEHIKPCKTSGQTTVQPIKHNVKTREPAVLEQRTPTGIRLTTINHDSTRSNAVNVLNNFNSSETFLKVTLRTTPPLAEDHPEVQALVVALQKAQLAASTEVKQPSSHPTQLLGKSYIQQREQQVHDRWLKQAKAAEIEREKRKQRWEGEPTKTTPASNNEKESSSSSKC
jgi:hypothetical protein